MALAEYSNKWKDRSAGSLCEAACEDLKQNFMFVFPCIITLYYIKNQLDAALAVLFISHYI